MTRERFLDPEVCKSEQVARLTDPWAKLLWDRIIVTSDDEGRRKASGYSLKADCFPCDGISIEDVERCRDALSEVGLIRLYQDGDGPLLDIPPDKWARYQKLKYKKASRYPEFPAAGEIRQVLPDSGGNAQKPPEPAGTAQDQPESVTGCGVEGGGGEGSGVDAVSSAAPKEAAEENGEDPRTFASEPVPAPSLPAPDGPEGGAEPAETTESEPPPEPDFTRAEERSWDRVFGRQTASWDGSNQDCRQQARERIELGYTSAQLVIAHVLDINRRKSKRPWRTLGGRMTLLRAPPDDDLREAGRLMRDAVEKDTS